MPEVTVRDARRADATAIGEVWAAALPQLVRSAARAAADLQADAALGRRRWVGLVDGVVAGTATARLTGTEQAYLSVEVHPDLGSRGVGTALLSAAIGAFPTATDLMGVSSDEPIALAFGVRNGFLPDGENQISRLDPASVPPVGDVTDGLSALTLDRLPDLAVLLETHNASAGDDPSGLSHQHTLETFLADWWGSPDNAPELSWALLDDSSGSPVVASFTSVQVDRPRRRCWSTMTATHPAYRGRGLARWVKQRMLNSVAAAGIIDAATANDVTNLSMIAVNDSLGYVPSGRAIRVRRRLPPD
jgi:GNAT superfamily N-acetyltransferase